MNFWKRKINADAGAIKQIPPMELKKLAMSWTRQMWLGELWQQNTWLGFPILQWPTDLLVLQEIVVNQKPRVIIETGSYQGGSAIFFASLLKLTGGGKVVSIDWPGLSPEALNKVKNHELGSMIEFITGDSTAPETVSKVRKMLGSEDNVMIVLDSDHSYSHVKKELEIYHQFVSPGGYLVVGDTICAELGKLDGYAKWIDDNPLRAVREFLLDNDLFICDNSREKFLVTFFPEGFLRRVK